MDLENAAAGEIVLIETHITFLGPRAQVADLAFLWLRLAGFSFPFAF